MSVQCTPELEGKVMNDQLVKKFDLPQASAQLLDDIRRMITEIRTIAAVTANAGLTMLFWRIGNRINQEILKGKRAEYGTKIVSTVSRQLEIEYGSGFSAATCDG